MRGKKKGESAASGDNDAAKDMKTAPGKDSKPAAEAKKRNAGGVVKKNVGGVVGAAPRANGGRAPRKSGGRTGCNMNPLSSAAKGTSPKGHKTPGSVD